MNFLNNLITKRLRKHYMVGNIFIKNIDCCVNNYNEITGITIFYRITTKEGINENFVTFRDKEVISTWHKDNNLKIK